MASSSTRTTSGRDSQNVNYVIGRTTTTNAPGAKSGPTGDNWQTKPFGPPSWAAVARNRLRQRGRTLKTISS